MPPQVEVLWADVDAAAALDWRKFLSADEHDRARRFRFPRDRERYVARRGILRLLLAHRLERTPAMLRFTANDYGKPALRDGGIEFNLSHSRGLALFALSREVAVGCDIEYHDRRFLAENIPERLFSSGEAKELRDFAPERQTAAFFDGWTRKEAYVKARGMGLALPLDSFDVSLAPGERPTLYRGCDGWSARSFAPAPNCSAAVVAQSDGWQIDAKPLDPLVLLARCAVA